MTNSSGISPADVKVLVAPDPVEEKTAGGVILADTSRERQKYATVRATLVAKGPNACAEWGAGNGPEPGARILTAQYAGMRAKGCDGVEYVLCNDEDVIAVLSDEAGR